MSSGAHGLVLTPPSLTYIPGLHPAICHIPGLPVKMILNPTAKLHYLLELPCSSVPGEALELWV